MRRLLAFLARDYYTETSYRLAFLSSLGGILFRVFIFYFLAQLVNDGAAPLLQEVGGDYFAFVLIGIALGGYFSTGLTGFAAALRQAQTTGTLEALMMTPTPVSLIVIGSAAWSYTYTTLRVLLYLLVGTLLLGLSLRGANVLGALISLLLALVAFASIGILAASTIMVFKRGDPLTGLFGQAANLLGGVYYPVAILPAWLQWLSRLLPITYALRAMRAALLDGAPWAVLAPDLLALALFCFILAPLALLIFRYAVERARLEGTLAHY